MNTQLFLSKILPSQGSYVLAVFNHGLKFPPQHNVFTDINDLADNAQFFDSRGLNVYHACASYVDPTLSPDNGLRKRENAGWVRSQWLDIDVGEGKAYATKKDAAMMIKHVCTQIKLPLPMMVSSGKGIHAYWVFDRDVTAAEAAESSVAFAQLIRQHGLAADPSRTKDLASILRPVGTRNHKDPANVRDVKVLLDADPVPYDYFCSRLPHLSLPAAPVVDEWAAKSTTPTSFPPSSGLMIVKYCNALAAIVEAKGVVEEPLWRDMLGVCKYTEEGASLAHNWSSGDPRYSFEETQRKFDNWTTPPPTCATIESHGGACEGCKHKARKSPIHLGYTEPEPVAATATPVEPAAPWVNKVTEQQLMFKMPDELMQLGLWEKGFRYKDGNLQQHVDATESEPAHWFTFSERYIYPYSEVVREVERDHSITYSFETHFCVLTPKGWRTTRVATKHINDAKALATELGDSAGVHFASTKQKTAMKAYVQSLMSNLRNILAENEEVKSYGWRERNFVLGDTTITADGEVSCLVANTMPQKMREGYSVKSGVKGTAREAAAKIDALYNREGAEPLQFCILAALAAPLVKLLGLPTYHGIPIGLTGASGQGKTTVAQIACSMYGDPGAAHVSAHSQGTTMAALLQRVAVAPNTPHVFDELHGLDGMQLPTVLYALSNGVPKQRLTSSATFNNTGSQWDTLTFVTSNSNINSLLDTQVRDRAEATKLRVWEIAIQEGFLGRVFGDTDAKAQIDYIVKNQYGALGRKWLGTVVKNQDAIRTLLSYQSTLYAPNSEDETRERFFYETLTCVMVAGRIAKKMGLFSFDLNKIEEWAKQHIASMRSDRAKTSLTLEDALFAIEGDCEGRTVTTESFPMRRLASDAVFHVETRSGLPPIARRCLKEGWLIITSAGLNDICRERGIERRWLLSELEKAGRLLSDATMRVDARGRMRLFRGTSLNNANTQTRVVGIDISDRHHHTEVIHTDNVTAFPTTVAA